MMDWRVLMKPRAQNDGLAYPYKASGTEWRTGVSLWSPGHRMTDWRILMKPRAQNDELAYPYKASGTEWRTGVSL